LATHQCRFVLDENKILINATINPGPEPVGPFEEKLVS
jgi:hypothetical protein